MLLALMMLIAEPRDGIPTFTTEEADAARLAWDECLKKQADRAATLTTDPSDVVVEVAFALCDREESDARFKWRRMIIVRSDKGLNDEEAKASADKFYDELVQSSRRYLLGRVSQMRQIKSLES